MKPILEIKNISKKFRIHHEQKPYLSIRDSVSNLFKSKTGSDEDFWALKDINFDVMPGESIGIIGKNGAGKSTLLKILSKITPPTDGKIISRGRIASLLEVGTGFHPELTGRENIFLNGSILGMRKAEIQKNFDAIVDFSGVEKFLDTPLKHYSSGMQLRLAFAVAAFLENEVLIIDEVLAVGDAEFQKKCMGKMEDVSKNQGRTVLFVSHNLSAIKQLCNKGALLSSGQISFYNSTAAAVEVYNKQNSHALKKYKVSNFKERKRGLKYIFINEVELDAISYLPISPFEIKIKVAKNENTPDVKNFDLSVFIFDSLQNVIYQISTVFLGKKNELDIKKTYTFKLDSLNLSAGNYSVGVWLSGNGIEQDYVDQIISFEVLKGNIYCDTNPLIVSIVQKQFIFSAI